MDYTLKFSGISLVFLLVSACQQTTSNISDTTTNKPSEEVIPSVSNATQANFTTPSSAGLLSQQAATSAVSFGNLAKNEISQSNENELDNDTVVTSTTQDLWKMAAPMETFVIEAGQENTLELKQGAIIEIPQNAFVYEGTNESVTGTVSLVAKEFLNMGDCLKAGLTTMSDKGLLESGGMMYIAASADGKKCALRQDKPMKVALPTWGKKDERMKLFTGKRKKNGQVTWQEMTKAQGEQLPASEAPKRKQKYHFNYTTGATYAYESYPDSSFEAFVSSKMTPIQRFYQCNWSKELDVYKIKNRSSVNINLREKDISALRNKSTNFFPVARNKTEINLSSPVVVKISQENILTHIDEKPAPNGYVRLTNKTLKALKYDTEDKWAEKKDANNQIFTVKKTEPLKKEWKVTSEKTFCKVYVSTNAKGSVKEILMKDYNFIIPMSMYKWIDYSLRQRQWKPNAEGIVFLDIYVGKSDFRKMKKWYANKANTLEECKQLYQTQYQKYLEECRAQYARNPLIRQQREEAQARAKMTVEEQEKAFEKDYRENSAEVNSQDVENYVFRTSEMGWINCDYFYNQPQMEMKLVVENGENVRSTVIFKKQKMVLNQIHQDGFCKIKLPRKHEIILWVVKEYQGKRYFALKEMTTGEKQVKITDFEELTFEKLNEITQIFSKISDS